ncbi:MAG: hypothetical protein ACP5KS_03645 [Candidatus Hydrogenedens sp.]
MPRSLLLNPDTITVEPSGITAGMNISANAVRNGDKINVRISSAGGIAESLYGSGVLFNILAKPRLNLLNECGLLHLVPDDGVGNGVRLYNVIQNQTEPLPVLLVDGRLCVSGDVFMEM